jgi:hypothetical protein
MFRAEDRLLDRNALVDKTGNRAKPDTDLIDDLARDARHAADLVHVLGS